MESIAPNKAPEFVIQKEQKNPPQQSIIMRSDDTKPTSLQRLHHVYTHRHPLRILRHKNQMKGGGEAFLYE
jgi:hypothetical protein